MLKIRHQWLLVLHHKPKNNKAEQLADGVEMCPLGRSIMINPHAKVYNQEYMFLICVYIYIHGG